MVHNMHVDYFIISNSSVSYLNVRKLKLFRGHLFLNAVKILLFISDAQYYVPVKLCRTAGIIHFIQNYRKAIS